MSRRDHDWRETSLNYSDTDRWIYEPGMCRMTPVPVPESCCAWGWWVELSWCWRICQVWRESLAQRRIQMECRVRSLWWGALEVAHSCLWLLTCLAPVSWTMMASELEHPGSWEAEGWEPGQDWVSPPAQPIRDQHCSVLTNQKRVFIPARLSCHRRDWILMWTSWWIHWESWTSWTWTVCCCCWTWWWLETTEELLTWVTWPLFTGKYFLFYSKFLKIFKNFNEKFTI